MTYVHFGTRHRYQVRRVPDDFEFPKEPKQTPEPPRSPGGSL
jgi:hypothetical protein